MSENETTNREDAVEIAQTFAADCLRGAAIGLGALSGLLIAGYVKEKINERRAAKADQEDTTDTKN